ESVEIFTKLLKDYLKDVCGHVSMECDTALEALYIDVSLIQGHIKTKSGKNANKCLEKELVIYDAAEREKAAIERSQIFETMSGKPKETKVIALLGQAGMGKSILVKKICQDWAKGEISQFEFVFWFECKRLNFSGKRYTVRDLLFELFAKPQEKCDEVFRYILHNPEKVLIIFDGFDDFLDYDGLAHCSACTSMKEFHTVKELFAGLLQKKVLHGCTMLITGRPKGAFNQYLFKVDKIVEVIGFSPQQIEEYMTKYFNGTPQPSEKVKLIKDCPFIYSYCYCPLLCRLVCFLCEALHKTGDKEFPITLTTLYLNVFQQKLMGVVSSTISETLKANIQYITKLNCLAWTGVQNYQNVLIDNLGSKELKEFALKHGFLTPFPINPDGKNEGFGIAFTNFIVQNFFGALHLTLAEDISDKGLVKLISLEQKKKKTQEDRLNTVRRFLVGLLFLEEDRYLNCLSEKIVIKKQTAVSRYLKKLLQCEPNANKLLELCHCVYEAQDSGLIRYVASKLSSELSFKDTRLNPPDVFVLQYVLRRANKKFSVDLRNTGIDLHGMKEIVKLKNVTSFRASIRDTIQLWETLQKLNDCESLRMSVEKYIISPFKAKSLKDIDAIIALVQIHRENTLFPCTDDAPCNESVGIPAVTNLKKLEFALGPVCGQNGFWKLVEVLPEFHSLQHLDLDTLSENKIGDKGVEKLAEVFPNLLKLETLNLSQNNITDTSVEKLANAFPILTSLKTISLYNNCISDSGAENLAKALPLMKTLIELDVKYNKITDVGAQKLTESLKSCPQIKSI
uniref:Class II major histocompatibility complex transactivator n=1 Tax=Latimeria chalumnae TaxID=7897 RepID=H3A4T2_LATCH